MITFQKLKEKLISLISDVDLNSLEIEEAKVGFPVDTPEITVKWSHIIIMH
jgi:hypothetical protein